jgi:RNA polymerase sigma-70 factor (ECF subfamily)
VSERREEFLAAFDAYSDRVRRVLGRSSGVYHRNKLDDLVQETFARAWRAWDTFDGRASRSTWLVPIALHAGTAHRRRKRPEPNTPAVDRHEASAPNAVLRTAVPEALARLPDDPRVTVVLFYFEAMTVAEVAATTKVPEGTVKTRLWRARGALAEALGDREALSLAEALGDREALSLAEALGDREALALTGGTTAVA